MNKVFVKKVNNLNKQVKELITNLGIKKLRKGSKIFIKINLSLDRDYPATNTKPDILGLIVKELSKKYEVIVGDSNASSCSADKALKVTGNYEAIINNGGKAINLSNDEKVLVNCNKCLKLKNHLMPKSIITADAVISLALLKTHVFTTITGTIKNMFGSYPDLKILHHQYLNQAIHDAVLITKPRYAIIDGRIGMEGRGPVEGTPRNVGIIMGSDNVVSCDTEAARIMGFNPRKIKHITILNKSIGGMNYELIGDKIRLKFKPATKGLIDKLQELSLKNKTLVTLLYKTPLFNAVKITAKTIKDIKRSIRIK